MSNQAPDDRLEALKALVSVLAVETERRDIGRLQAFSEMLMEALDDDGRRYEWTHDEGNREWMRQTLDSVGRDVPTPGRLSAQEIRDADPIDDPNPRDE